MSVQFFTQCVCLYACAKEQIKVVLNWMLHKYVHSTLWPVCAVVLIGI